VNGKFPFSDKKNIPTDGVAIPRIKKQYLDFAYAWQHIRGIATPSVGSIFARFNHTKAKQSGAERWILDTLHVALTNDDIFCPLIFLSFLITSFLQLLYQAGPPPPSPTRDANEVLG